MPRNDFQCQGCGKVEERFEKVADIDAGVIQRCECGADMKRIPPLVADNGYCGTFHSFDSMTFDQKVTSRTQLESLRKQYNLKPTDRPKKYIPKAGRIYSYRGQTRKDSRAHGTYTKPH